MQAADRAESPRPNRAPEGMIKVRNTTFNQNGEAVQIQVGNLVVPRRTTAAAR